VLGSVQAVAHGVRAANTRRYSSRSGPDLSIDLRRTATDETGSDLRVCTYVRLPTILTVKGALQLLSNRHM